MVSDQDIYRFMIRLCEQPAIQWLIRTMEGEQVETYEQPLDDSGVMPEQYRQPARYSMDHDLVTAGDADAVKMRILEASMARIRQREQARRQPQQYARSAEYGQAVRHAEPPGKPTVDGLKNFYTRVQERAMQHLNAGNAKSWAEVEHEILHEQGDVARYAKPQPADLHERIIERHKQYLAAGIHKSHAEIRLELSR